MNFNLIKMHSVILSALFIVIACGSNGESQPKFEQSLIVPAYFDPDGEPAPWDRLEAAAIEIPDKMTVIVNPWDGPEWRHENTYRAYLERINALRESGPKVLGYVYTLYMDPESIRDHISEECDDNKREAECSRILCGADTTLTDAELIEKMASQVECHIDMWYRDYDVDGIFLDEVPTRTGKELLYGNFYSLIKDRSYDAMVVSNQGATEEDSRSYLSYGDIPISTHLIVFEKSSPLSEWSPPAWIQEETSGKIGALVEGVSERSMQLEFERSNDLNMGLIYITDREESPWGDLPSYFEELVELMK